MIFAKTNCATDIRKHIESRIAKVFHNNHPELTRFYPRDSRTGSKKELLGKTITINLDVIIAGLSKEIEI